VLLLDDGDSTDSGWGSSSGDEKSSGQEQRRRERDGDDDSDDAERSSTSGGSGDSSASRDGAPLVESGSEVAVLLHPGGVTCANGSHHEGVDAAPEAKEDGDPSDAAQGKGFAHTALPPAPSFPSPEVGLLEYSGSGRDAWSVEPGGNLRSSGAVSNDPGRSGGATARSGGGSAAIDGTGALERVRMAVGSSGREDADPGVRLSSLTGELLGVDFVDVPADKS